VGAEPLDTRALALTNVAIDWARAGPLRRTARNVRAARDRVEGIRTFASGTRAQIVVSRAIERDTDTIWKRVEETIDMATGLVVEERAPWRPTDEHIARAVAVLSVPAAVSSLRATSSDGRLMFFVIGRNPNEWWDPDAGTLTSYDVTLGLWDDVDRAWRWETSDSPMGLGVGTWILEQASFDFTLDDTRILGRSSDAIARQAYAVADGRLQWYATEPLPRPKSLADGNVLAADGTSTHAVVARGTHVELWDVRNDRVVGSVDLGPISDVATAAALVSPEGEFLVGTELGHLLRIKPSACSG
jgi:hypothetical protein